MVTIPNASIVMRDDWIEVSICSIYGGGLYEYKFYPSGRVTVQELPIGSDYYPASEISEIGFYQAMSDIAEISTSNVEAMENED